MIIFWVFGFLVCGIVDVITNINTLVFSLKKIKLSMGWFIFFIFFFFALDADSMIGEEAVLVLRRMRGLVKCKKVNFRILLL